MALSQQATDIISEFPLEDTLDRIRQRFRDLNDANTRQEDVASLLLALVGSSAAFRLPSPNGEEGLVTLGHFGSLVHHVVSDSSDTDIWQAVFDIIDNLSALTPPPSSIAPTFKGTPVKSSSNRLADDETRDIVERELFYEIRDCAFRNVGGFCDKFFNTKSWHREQMDMLEAVMAEHDGKRWRSFPSTPTEPLGGKLEYKHVLVVGEQKSSYDTGRFKADFLQLTRLVRGVFTDQPTRRFVHAFTLCASMMELWVFDRSGHVYRAGR
ncbi:hypothetical protein GGR57DRAFT_497938 [Xylariaceae sp. FL1272]|nr:hypothetical protein GGR57DRAFT_497938 [Xylariaceae sp. FL1272]